ncbi:MAG: hypothetical protein ABW201_05350 [Candidatus Thiodiazotropha sp.]
MLSEPKEEDLADMSFSAAASRWLNCPWDATWGDVTNDKKDVICTIQTGQSISLLV